MCPIMMSAVKKMMQKALESQVMGVIRVSCTKAIVAWEFDGSEGASYTITWEKTVPSKEIANTKTCLDHPAWLEWGGWEEEEKAASQNKVESGMIFLTSQAWVLPPAPHTHRKCVVSGNIKTTNSPLRKSPCAGLCHVCVVLPLLAPCFISPMQLFLRYHIIVYLSVFPPIMNTFRARTALIFVTPAQTKSSK